MFHLRCRIYVYRHLKMQSCLKSLLTLPHPTYTYIPLPLGIITVFTADWLQVEKRQSKKKRLCQEAGQDCHIALAFTNVDIGFYNCSKELKS